MSAPARRAILGVALAVGLAGPTAVAFFAGGYYPVPRLTAALVACVLVVLAALLAPSPLPAGRGGRLALLGLALLAGVTGLSIAWAPVSGRALGDLERLLLYAAALTAAAALLRGRAARRIVEPALAAGVLVVMLYGLSERLLPGVVDLATSATAFGRLEQPLTYWNAMGGLAAIGIVLCVRIAGDATRTPGLRAAAAAAAVPIGTALYLSFSRGAIAAAAAGLIVLFVVASSRAQLRAIATALAAVLVCGLVASGLDHVRELSGGPDRESEGALMLALLVVAAAAAAAAVYLSSRRDDGALPVLRVRGRHLAAALAVMLLAVVAAGGAFQERRTVRAEPAQGATNARLTSLDSSRYSYWSVAADAFAEYPLAGVGSGGFAGEWLRERETRDTALDAHSVYLETAAELGLAGLAALALFLAGAGLSAAAAYRRAPVAAAGPIAAVAVWMLHSGLDWDWEMPAVTLPALILLGALIATAEEPAPLGAGERV